MKKFFVVFHCLILLYVRLPLDFFKYVTTFFSRENKPTLYQRYISTIISTILETLPLWMVRGLVYSFGFINNHILNGLWLGGSKRSYWCRKLKIKDANWRGYFIAENAEKLDVGQDADVVILYAHGGGFVTGGALLHFTTFIDWIQTWKSTYGTTTQILSVEYGLAPKNPFPGARDNMLECYEWLVNEQGINPSKIVFGGNLAVISVLELIQNPYAYSVDLPSSLILLSPCLSGLPTSKSFNKNKSYDIINTQWLERSFNKYMIDTNLSSQCSLISPIYEKKLGGLPKIWACAGEFEVFLDDVKQFIENARSQSVNTECWNVMNGGNLAVISVLELIQNPYAYSVDLPSSLILLSPCLSGLPTSKSFNKNKSYDIINTQWLERSFNKYMIDTNLSSQCSLISPIYEKKLGGLPKIWACAGEFEVFLDDVKQFIENARSQSVNTEFVMENNNFHGYAVCKLLDRNN
ncbi:5244_t:CDS:2, partial [Entrophospora sp. SA101]